MFEQLDADEDGIISSTTINTSYLTEDQKAIMEPFFMLLDQSTKPMVFEDFAIIMEHFVSELSIIERNTLLKIPKTDGPTHKPTGSDLMIETSDGVRTTEIRSRKASGNFTPKSLAFVVSSRGSIVSN
jgi:hypothetical protein